MKRKALVLAAVLFVACAGMAGFSVATEPALPPLAAAPPQAADAQAIRRGAQLVAVGDCMVCHTAQGGTPLAGGRPLDTPFGTVYSTNITPDNDTGIGSWSLDAFKRAMRKGVARDGHLLYPAFPYPYFTHMSDGDIADVYAYLMSRQPVHAIAPGNRLMFPLNFRPLVAGWNLLYLHQAPVPPDSSQSAQWNRGRYLVDGLGHCAACHSPTNALGAQTNDPLFAGGSVDGWDAPALTELANRPTPWTREQLVSYLRTGLATEHGAAAGPMRPVTQELADASPADVEAMATYLMSLQKKGPTPAAPEAAPAAPRQTSAADQSSLLAGRTLFTAACASCHGMGSPMSTLGGRPSLSQSTAVNAESPRNVVRMILDGNGWQDSEAAHYMPSFAGTLTDAQIAELANYVRARFSHDAPWPALDEAAVTSIRKESPKP